MSEKTKAHQRYRLKPTEDFPKGEIVPGVTTIIGNQLAWNKNVLIAWARREALAGNDPEKILTEAGDIGTCTHYLIQCHIKGVKPDTSQFTKDQIDKAENGFLGFLDWEKDARLSYKLIEFPVISEQYRYGGLIDITATQNGSLYLLDVKTSRNIYPEHTIQIAAYHHAYEEQEQEQIHKFILLHVGKHDGSFAAHNIPGPKIAQGWRVFQILRELYNLQKEMSQ
jgi:hypothetical protein